MLYEQYRFGLRCLNHLGSKSCVNDKESGGGVSEVSPPVSAGRRCRSCSSDTPTLQDRGTPLPTESVFEVHNAIILYNTPLTV